VRRPTPSSGSPLIPCSTVLSVLLRVVAATTAHVNADSPGQHQPSPANSRFSDLSAAYFAGGVAARPQQTIRAKPQTRRGSDGLCGVGNHQHGNARSDLRLCRRIALRARKSALQGAGSADVSGLRASASCARESMAGGGSSPRGVSAPIRRWHNVFRGCAVANRACPREDVCWHSKVLFRDLFRRVQVR
jgi:hypothetical protein